MGLFKANKDKQKSKFKPQSVIEAGEKFEAAKKEAEKKEIEVTRSVISNESNKKYPDKIKKIDYSKILPNPYQPRTVFEKIDELAESIFDHGLMTPVTVFLNDEDNKYYLIAGERRLRAVQKLLKDGKVEDALYPVYINEGLLTREEKKSLATIENTHRVGMTVIDTANNVASYIHEGMSYREVAKLFSIGKTVVSRYLTISKLPKKVQDILNIQGLNSVNKIELLHKIDNLEKQIEFAHLIVNDISLSQLELQIKKYYKNKVGDIPSKVTLETPYDYLKPVSKILPKSIYKKLSQEKKNEADEIFSDIRKLQEKLSMIIED